MGIGYNVTIESVYARKAGGSLLFPQVTVQNRIENLSEGY